MAGVSTVTGFAANVSSNVLSSLSNKVVQAVKMVIYLPQDVTDMKDQARRLDDIVHDVSDKLAQEQKPAQRIVRTWLDKANGAIQRSRSIDEDYQQHKYCLTCCPNCVHRYRISKHIRDWKLTVAQLHSERQSDFPSSGEYGDHAPAAQIPIQIPEPGFVGNAIQSAQLKLEQLLTDQDTNIRIIAVHGMGGVGKTSLLQTMNNSLQVRNSFDLIIWVTVSKDCEISNLQDMIAKRLNLHNFPDRSSSLEEKMHRLNSYLGDKKFLMILDDMWKSFELHTLGVPLKGSKIVLTTRIKDVCTAMAAQKIMIVEPLSEEEGWQLFRRRAFPNGNVPQEIADVARKIARECKGLPLAINVIAGAMRNHSYQHEWEHALSQMQNIDERFYGLHDEVEERLFQRLKWSYNGLPDYLKTCFLSFAAYPEDYEITCEELIDRWIAEGVVKGSGDSYLPDTAHSFLNYLRDRCLIEVVGNDEVGRIESVKIHDILRDLAILIAEKEHRCFFKVGQGITDFPVEEVDGKGWEIMSLMHNHLRSLPTTLACSSLSVLLLRENRGIKEVPASFLSELSSLKVLDLSGTNITSLPPCVGNLKRLASLQLQSTDICELPESIGDLKELQFLNVGYCQNLRCLPERINELTRLRALHIWGCTVLIHLPRQISELVSLESLCMLDSILMDFEEDSNAERKRACFKDLQSLLSLRVLEVRIKSPVKKGVMVNWSKMRHLTLQCHGANQGYLPEDMQAMKNLEYLSLDGCDVERVPSWVSEFRKLAHLHFWYCEQLKELPAELQELPCLRRLWIADCNKLEELELGMGFPNLQELRLYWLGSLQCVGAGTGAVGAAASASGGGGLGEGASPLPMLNTLEVRRCPRLKRMRGRWDKLKCLEVIKGRCRGWWDAIQWDDPTIKTSLETKFKERPGL